MPGMAEHRTIIASAPEPPIRRDAGRLPIGQASHDDALVGFYAIPDPVRKLPHWGAAIICRAGDNLILEGILADAYEGAADLLDEAVAETGLARLVVVLRGGDIRFCQRRDADWAAQDVG